MTEEKIKLPRSSYEEICKIIIAYGRLTEPKPLGEIHAISGIGQTVVSANNSFLANIGLIQGGKYKEATPLGHELAQALEHELPDEIISKWRKTAEANDFLSKMALAVTIRRSMEPSSLEAHIAYTAGEPNKGYVMVGARTIIDILRAGGLVREEDGKIVPGESSPPLKPVVTPPDASPPRDKSSVTSQTVAVAQQSGIVRVNIEIKVDAKPSDLDGLGEKLRNLIKSLSEHTEN